MNRRSKLMRREGIAGLLFVTPQLIYFLLFFLLPLNRYVPVQGTDS